MSGNQQPVWGGLPGLSMNVLLPCKQPGWFTPASCALMGSHKGVCANDE